MSIQWYPGHMHKARKQMLELLPRIDVLVEILDARVPHSSQNPVIAEACTHLPVIKLLSKDDLADPAMTQAWQTHFEQQDNTRTLAVDLRMPGKLKSLIPELVRKLAPTKAEQNRTINVLVAGIPNVGKSTFINTMAGRPAAKTGNEPAVTKAQQQINLEDGVILFDSPGMLWPKLEHNNTGFRLAATSAIKNTVIDFEDLGLYLADYLLPNYPEGLKERYGLKSLPKDSLGLISAVCQRRGGMKANEVDYYKGGEILVSDFRAARLGRITLETPEVIAQELLEVEQARALKAERDAEKEAKKALKKAGKRHT
ncbi:ribosome biogenesis GTPase YlqF [Simiduia agarivorans]|uniref:Ribosome biogenesis GTPase A n=1 Tax=Simiduia agarivorans (strain DSM 21679 / JCM 13881 / BCRC 17597 / SA1) TaxID=1117647 RepID=K4KH52_SIMAS|nr:ribosome biogenesis GTPase YlqF [Simiduia agarivorans]AFU97268.1 GTPase YlqF [Simiduia agarivorans SA1 = DSM 21679]